MRANEFLSEVFQPGKTNWEWARLGHNEVSAFFKVGRREYLWQAFVQRPKKWEIQFRLIRKPDTDPDELDLFGATGTGNSAEVLSTAVDITRAFLKEYGLDKVEEITFVAKEDSRIGLYAKMIQRLLPNWDLYKKYDEDYGMQFTLTDPRAYDKPENKLDELYDPETSFTLDWDNTFGPKEMHADAYDRQGRVINIDFVPVSDKSVEVEFTRGGSYDVTGRGDASFVFATVIQAFKEYLQGYRPKYIIFSAKEGSRYSLYEKLVSRFAPTVGYKQYDLNKLKPETREKIGATGTNVILLYNTSPT